MRSLPQAPDVDRATDAAGDATTVSSNQGEGEAKASAEALDLVDALRRGEPWAAQEVWDRHAGNVRRLMGRALGPRPEVEDLTQEVFLRVFSRIRVLREAGALREFVMAVGINVLKRELRRRWVRRKTLLSEDGSVPDVATPGADPEAREALARCYVILDKLSARERTAFVLRYMEERTLDEVAQGLGVSLSTAKRLVSRASERVSKQVGSDEGLRSFFERRDGVAEGPRSSENNTETTGGKSNVTG